VNQFSLATLSTEEAMAWGAIASFLACFAIVITKQWHGRLTLDSAFGVQKIHDAPTPRVGGIGILLGVLIAWMFLPERARALFTPMLIAGAPAFVFGLAEDLTKRVGVRERLLATFASGVLAWWLTGQSLTSVRVWGIDHLLTWLPLSIAVTAFALAGMANAINIIDGANGLASGVLMVCLTAIGAAAWNVGDVALAEVSLVIAAVLVGFWVMNFPLGKIFLGDGGAYVMGFWVGWLAVLLPMRNPGVSPWGSLLICAYPVLEVLFSIARRMSSNASPGSADGRHLHSMLGVLLANWSEQRWPRYMRNAAVSPFVWAFAAAPALVALSVPHHTVTMALLFLAFAGLYAMVYVGLVTVVGHKVAGSGGAVHPRNAEGRLHNKILFVNRFFYPDNSATSQILGDLAFHLAAQGEHVEVITSRLTQHSLALLSCRETVRGVEVRRVWSSHLGGSSLLGRLFDYIAFYVGAARALWQLADSATTVVVKTDPPLLSVAMAPIARLRGAKLVNWLQDVYPEVAGALKVRTVQGPVLQLLRVARNVSLSAADANVVLGERMRILMRGQGIASDKLHIIHNWADRESIKPIVSAENPLRKSWNLQGKFVVGYSGNLGRAHEYRTIIHAAELVTQQGRDDIVFLFIGGGVQRQFLEKEVQDRGIKNLRFLPYQERDQLSQSLSAADVHLISLNPALEGLIVPSKFYGVAAAGRPSIFIGDPDGEIPRILRDGACGLAIRSGDALELAAVIARLADNPIVCSTMGASARILLETHFDRRVAMDAWTKVLEEA
jgi:colanic acid biosynthesis glycosyl transferase WcaI